MSSNDPNTRVFPARDRMVTTMFYKAFAVEFPILSFMLPHLIRAMTVDITESFPDVISYMRSSSSI